LPIEDFRLQRAGPYSIVPLVEPKISIVTPAFNAEQFIAETMDSVLAQTYPVWELLIVLDVKSTDTTKKIVQTYATRDARIRLIEHPQADDVSSNRNLGIKAAQGDYIAFLDSDDKWHPRKLELQLEFMERNQIKFSFHAFNVVSFDGETVQFRRNAPETIAYSDLLKHNCIGCLTVMLKKEILNNFYFKNELHEDFCLWLDILKNGNKAHGLPDFLADYRLVPRSRSYNKVQAAASRWSILREREKLGLLSSVLNFIAYTLSSLKLRV